MTEIDNGRQHGDTDVWETYQPLLAESADQKFMDPAANDIPGFLDRVELTFEGTSKSARGLLYDAEVVHKCCIATEKESRSISSQMRGFSIMEFAQKLKASVGCEESGLTPSGLKLLWAKVCSLIWVTPKAKYLYGTFEKGLPPPKPKRVVKNASRTNDGPVVIPDISKHLEKQEDTGTVAQVNNVHRCIMREYKENGCQPILYWKIILNPESFTKSIENMSHLAFLTQDKSLRMSLEREEIFIEPVLKGASQPSWTSMQSCLPFNYKIWQHLVQKYKIKKAMITTE